MLETRKLKENRSEISDEEAEKSFCLSVMHLMSLYRLGNSSNLMTQPANCSDVNMIKHH